MFIGVVNMVANKCMIKGGTVALNTCLSWPDFKPYHLKMVSAVPVHV